MDTKKEIRAYAAANNITVAEAKQYFINEAKKRNMTYSDITFNKKNTYIFRNGDDYIVQLVNDSPIGLSPKEWVEHFMRHALYAETKRRQGGKGNIDIYVVEKIIKRDEMLAMA
jgi:hypothetical protein